MFFFDNQVDSMRELESCFQGQKVKLPINNCIPITKDFPIFFIPYSQSPRNTWSLTVSHPRPSYKYEDVENPKPTSIGVHALKTFNYLYTLSYIDMWLVNFGLNYQFWTFSILVVGIKFETNIVNIYLLD
jgi:hypothetical protein